MKTYLVTAFLLLLLAIASCKNEDEHNFVRVVYEGVVSAKKWTQSSLRLNQMENKLGIGDEYSALGDCLKLYEDSEERLGRLLVSEDGYHDRLCWLSGVLANHKTCLDGLHEKGHDYAPQEAKNLTRLVSRALSMYAKEQSQQHGDSVTSMSSSNSPKGLLAGWDATHSRADYVVAKDGSGTYKTINEAVKALGGRKSNHDERVVIYVKSGVYAENVEIKRGMRNVMFVGDGIDRTIVTGKRNVRDGATTYNSATFIVSADGFWARDMTFENTAGPEKHQAVAITVESDHSVFYRCSFRAYQDTLLVHSLRQFYRDCHIYGTVDFIFGNAAAVLQNCRIFVRKPMNHQANMITAQGRGDPNERTGISIHMSQVAPASDFEAVKGSFKTYLGRPWKEYSRTVFLKTDLDGLIHPKGWTEWRGDYGISTVYYGEYMNYGKGAATTQRVKWPGVHVLRDSGEAGQFSVTEFIQGEAWIPVTGIPFSPHL